MTIKKTKRIWHRPGSAFVYDDVQVTFDDPAHPTPQEQQLLKQFTKGLPPRDQVDRWKPHAQRLGVSLEDLAMAESLIDQGGHVKPRGKETFKACLARLQLAVELAQAEQTFIPLAVKGQKFDKGPKSDRVDTLAKQMRKAWTAFIKENRRAPTAFELWDWIPETGKILEKTADNVIHWKRANGEETSTEFKSFQNRYTTLKKKLSRNVTSE